MYKCRRLNEDSEDTSNKGTLGSSTIANVHTALQPVLSPVKRINVGFFVGFTRVLFALFRALLWCATLGSLVVRALADSYSKKLCNK